MPHQPLLDPTGNDPVPMLSVVTTPDVPASLSRIVNTAPVVLTLNMTLSDGRTHPPMVCDGTQAPDV